MEKKAFTKKIIIDENIVLKKHPVTFRHADKVFNMVAKNRNHLLPWLEWAEYTKKIEDSFDYLQSCHKDWLHQKSAEYAIYFKNKYVGNIGMISIKHKNESGEIGYWIDKDCAGQGIMSKCVKALETEFFNRGMNRIVIRADVDNIASYSVAEKNNYTFEGISRQEVTFNNGEHRDTKNYSKLKHEWEYYKNE